MSSDLLLEQVENTVKESFLDSKNIGSLEEVHRMIAKEQVRLASLRRQQELAIKLASELPDRISRAESKIAELERSGRELITQDKARRSEIEKLKNRQTQLLQQVEDICKQIVDNREATALKNFQKDNLWFLISQVVDLRKNLVNAKQSPKLAPSTGDFEYLSSLIERNDKLIREIESLL
jgi:hypothetical protein